MTQDFFWLTVWAFLVVFVGAIYIMDCINHHFDHISDPPAGYGLQTLTFILMCYTF